MISFFFLLLLTRQFFLYTFYVPEGAIRFYCISITYKKKMILCQSSFGMGGYFSSDNLVFLFPHVAVIEDGEGI
jgi:hypothetical protein